MLAMKTHNDGYMMAIDSNWWLLVPGYPGYPIPLKIVKESETKA